MHIYPFFQGVASANILALNRKPAEEIIFNDPNYGMDKPMLDTSRPTGKKYYSNELKQT